MHELSQKASCHFVVDNLHTVECYVFVYILVNVLDKIVWIEVELLLKSKCLVHVRLIFNIFKLVLFLQEKMQVEIVTVNHWLAMMNWKILMNIRWLYMR